MANNKYTTDQIAEALKKTNGYITLAARLLKCEPKTIYRRLKSNQALKELLEEIREGDLDIAEQKLREAILRGEPWAITLKLKTQGRKRGYVERTEISGAVDSEPITFIIKETKRGEGN